MDIKFQIQPKEYINFQTAISKSFPDWKRKRRVQTAKNNADVVIVHPLSGYRLSEIEQMRLDEIIAEFEDVEMAVAA